MTGTQEIDRWPKKDSYKVIYLQYTGIPEEDNLLDQVTFTAVDGVSGAEILYQIL